MWPKPLVVVFLAAMLLVAATSHLEDIPAPETTTVATNTEKPKIEQFADCLLPPPDLSCTPSSDQNKNFTEPCRLDSLKTTLLCCDINQKFTLIEKLGSILIEANITRLFIYNSSMDLNVSTDSSFRNVTRNLTSFTYVNGHLNITGSFSPNIRYLNLSGNTKNNFKANPDLIYEMKNLKVLDLSRNNITNLPSINPEVKNLSLDASGNPDLLCPEVKALMNKITIQFLNLKESTCKNNSPFQWFISNDILPIEHLIPLANLDRICPGTWKCTCDIFRIDIVPNKPPTVSLVVDCSRRNLTELPELPANTVALNLSTNNIKSLKGIKQKSYHHVRQLDLDNNNIMDINDLEGRFIQNVVYLSLRNNGIKELPTYFLSHAIDRNLNERFIFLGGNQLNCDCGTVQQDMVWLISNRKIVKDYDKVGCNNFPEKVIELQQTKVCLYKRVWTDYIYYIIAGEVALLIFLIAKVSYDYWVFKTAGYLPWPANKMPKMPCDWVFET